MIASQQPNLNAGKDLVIFGIASRRMERCSASLVIKEIQIKQQWEPSSYFPGWPSSKAWEITSVWKDMEELEPLGFGDRNVKRYSCCGGQFHGSKKLNIELPYDPVILLVGR